MVPGIPNPYMLTPLNKMWLIPLKQGAESVTAFDHSNARSVLYNPSTLKISRVLAPQKQKDEVPNNEAQSTGQKFTMNEILEVDLFYDSFSAGAETTDVSRLSSNVRSLKYGANSILPSPMKWAASIQDGIKWILELSSLDDEQHAQSWVAVKWGTICFGGLIMSCVVDYTKFNEMGKAVRAIVHLTIFGSNVLNHPNKFKFLFSPDTSKFHTIQQNETLNDLSRIAYDGDPTQWRHIAEANNIANPRTLRSGSVVRLPAITD